MKQKRIMLTFILVFLCFSLFFLTSEPLGEKETGIYKQLAAILPEVDEMLILQLIKTGKVEESRYRQEDMSPSLFPHTSLSKKVIAFWDDAIEPSFIIETLFLHKKTNAVKSDSMPKILRAISTLEGLEFHSSDEKKAFVLYEKSYPIDSPETRKRILDPINSEQKDFSVYALQKDLTAGEYVYKYNFVETNEGVGFCSENVETITYLFLKIMKENMLKISLSYYDLGDYVLSYGISRTKCARLPGMARGLRSSFSDRTEAIYKDFIKKYDN